MRREIARDGSTVEGYCAARRAEKTGENLDGRTLPGAVWTEKAQHFARSHREGDVPDGGQSSVVLG